MWSLYCELKWKQSSETHADQPYLWLLSCGYALIYGDNRQRICMRCLLMCYCVTLTRLHRIHLSIGPSHSSAEYASTAIQMCNNGINRLLSLIQKASAVLSEMKKEKAKNQPRNEGKIVDDQKVINAHHFTIRIT